MTHEKKYVRAGPPRTPQESDEIAGPQLLKGLLMLEGEDGLCRYTDPGIWEMMWLYAPGWTATRKPGQITGHRNRLKEEGLNPPPARRRDRNKKQRGGVV